VNTSTITLVYYVSNVSQATSGVGDAAVIFSQGAVSKISFSFLKSAQE